MYGEYGTGIITSTVCHFIVFTSNIRSFAPFFSTKVSTIFSRMIKTPIQAVIMKGDGTGGKDEHCLIQIEMRSRVPWQWGKYLCKIQIQFPSLPLVLHDLQRVTGIIHSPSSPPCWFPSSLNRGSEKPQLFVAAAELHGLCCPAEIWWLLHDQKNLSCREKLQPWEPWDVTADPSCS